MKVYNINTPYFNRETTCLYPFEPIEDEQGTLIYTPPLDASELYCSTKADGKLSFVIFDTRTLADCSFVLLKPSNLNDREKGVEIIAMGYSCKEAFVDLMGQLKFNIFMERNERKEYKYDYLWASDCIFEDDGVKIEKGKYTILNRE